MATVRPAPPAVGSLYAACRLAGLRPDGAAGANGRAAESVRTKALHAAKPGAGVAAQDRAVLIAVGVWPCAAVSPPSAVRPAHSPTTARILRDFAVTDTSTWRAGRSSPTVS